MRKPVVAGIGGLITVAGIVFALQGAGVLGGSSMSGVTFWAIAGPVIAVVGLLIAALALLRRSPS